MHIVDEIFRDFKEFHYIDDLKKMKSENERFDKIREVVSNVNVLKAELHDLTLEEQLYLFYKIQEKGVELNLCPSFKIFFSGKNNCFHHVCELDDTRTHCKGDIKNCVKKRAK